MLSKCKCFEKKIIILLAILVTISNIAGCSVKKKDKLSEVESSNHYYTRSEIKVPVEDKPLYISKSQSDGIYVVTGDDYKSKDIWYVDKGDNWEKKCDISEILNIDSGAYCDAFVSPDGGFFVEYIDDSNKKEERVGQEVIKYAFIDAQGKKNAISLELPVLDQSHSHEHGDSENKKDDYNYIIFAKFIDGYIYVIDVNYNIYEINLSDFNVRQIFENKEFDYIDDYYVYDRTLIMWVNEMVCFEGIDSHDNEDKISERFFSFFDKAKQNMKPLHMDVDDGILWVISGDKIGTYNLESNVIAEYKAVGNSQDEYVLGQSTSNGVLYTLSGTYDNSTMRIYKYSESSDEFSDDVYGDKIKIWTLNSTAYFEEAVRYFTDKYPNIEVEVVEGMYNSDSSITEADAIKNLNTELMSGDGPDIMYLDGVNIDKYIDADMLYDMTDLANELKDTGDYFNNLLEALNRDGKIYVMPSSVSLVGKVGTKEDIDASENILGFADYIDQQDRAHSIIHADLVPTYVLYAYYRDIQGKLLNGEIEKKQLTEFFYAAKKIYDVAGDTNILLDPVIMQFGANYAGGYDGTYDFVIGNRYDIALSSISCNEMAEQIGGVVELPANDYKENFVPRGCVAISNKSNNTDMAKEFIRIALSEECQGGIYGALGFRLNRNAQINFEKNMLSMNVAEAGTSTDAEGECEALDKKLGELFGTLEMVREPICVDMILDKMVFDEMNEYILGSIELDQAVEETIEKLELYLAE